MADYGMKQNQVCILVSDARKCLSQEPQFSFC